MTYLKYISYTFIILILAKQTWGTTQIQVNNVKPEEDFLILGSDKAEFLFLMTTNGKVRLNVEQIRQQPELLLDAFIAALRNNDMRSVSLLFPIYQQQEKLDVNLVIWARAVIAHQNGKLTESITLYRQLIARYPNNRAMRLQLAIALFRNNQYEAAKEQFNKLRNEKLSKELAQLIQHYLIALQKQNQWEIYAALNYLHENNVNNAPKITQADGFTPSSQPEKAQGIGYFMALNKNYPLVNNLFIRSENYINGKYYWNNKKYNELSLKLGFGGGYRNADTELTFVPFIEQFWYSGGESSATNSASLQSYSKQIGAELTLQHWLRANWKISSTLEYVEQRYSHNIRKKSDGNQYAIVNKIYYMPHSQQQWFIGLDYHRRNAEWKAYAFNRYAIQLGWNQEWTKGISTFLNVSYARRVYRSTSAYANDIFAPSFFKFAQKNHEYFLGLTIWHRAIHWQGITPKLTWSYQKVNSNNPFAIYDRHRIYLTFSKTF